jgi:uncharacterized protein YdaU (DUF1376 family)
MPSPHVLPLHVGDLAKSTLALTPTELGVLLLFWAHQWVHGALPNDDQELARIGRIPHRLNRNVLRTLKCRFPRGADGLLRDPDLAERRAASAAFAASQREKGDARARTATRDERGHFSPAGHQPATSHPVSSVHRPVRTNDQQATSRGTSLREDRRAREKSSARGHTETRAPRAWRFKPPTHLPGLHEEFVRLRNHIDAEQELGTWYARVNQEFTGQPGANMYRFWRARYEEQWPPSYTTEHPRSKTVGNVTASKAFVESHTQRRQ